MYTDVDEFPLYRHYYLRVNNEGRNRLTVGTFLTGLTFGTFTARLAVTALTGLNLQTLLVAAIDTFLGTATFLFLLTTLSTYTALQLLARLSPSAQAALGAPTPVALDDHDARRLKTAYTAYEEPANFILWALGLIVASLLLMAFLASPVVGIAVAFILLLLLYRLPRSLDATLDALNR